MTRVKRKGCLEKRESVSVRIGVCVCVRALKHPAVNHRKPVGSKEQKKEREPASDIDTNRSEDTDVSACVLTDVTEKRHTHTHKYAFSQTKKMRRRRRREINYGTHNHRTERATRPSHHCLSLPHPLQIVDAAHTRNKTQKDEKKAL